MLIGGWGKEEGETFGWNNSAGRVEIRAIITQQLKRSVTYSRILARVGTQAPECVYSVHFPRTHTA